MSVPPQSAAPAEHREWDDDSAIMVQSGQLGLGLRVYRVTPSQAARLRLAGPGPGMMPVIPGPAAAAGPRARARGRATYTVTGGRARAGHWPRHTAACQCVWSSWAAPLTTGTRHAAGPGLSRRA